MTELSQDLLETMVEAYNARDLDAVMSFFAEDAVFDWFNGQRFEGKAAIRAVMANAFDAVDALHYEATDTRIVGDKAICEQLRSMTTKRGDQSSIPIVDILTFRNGLIVLKDTFYKQIAD